MPGHGERGPARLGKGADAGQEVVEGNTTEIPIDSSEPYWPTEILLRLAELAATAANFKYFRANARALSFEDSTKKWFAGR